MKDNPQFTGKENQDRSHLSLTREQLYELVWSKPMQHLVNDYGVSDRAMAKLCARNQVPVPPRGYWAKKSAGQKVVRPSHPAFVAKGKPKPKPTEPEVQKPAEKRAKLSNATEDRDKEIKKIIRDYRCRLSNSIRYSILIDSWSCDYSFGLNSIFNPLRPLYLNKAVGTFPWHLSWGKICAQGQQVSPPGAGPWACPWGQRLRTWQPDRPWVFEDRFVAWAPRPACPNPNSHLRP